MFAGAAADMRQDRGEDMQEMNAAGEAVCGLHGDSSKVKPVVQIVLL